jgi:hypothetical protein
LGGIFIKDERVRVSGVYQTRDATKIHLDANSRQKWIKVLFAVSALLLFSVFSAYVNYNYCVDADFPSSKPRFENLGQDNLLADELNKFEVSRPSLLPTILESIHPAKFLSSFQKSPYDQEPVILRC